MDSKFFLTRFVTRRQSIHNLLTLFASAAWGINSKPSEIPFGNFESGTNPNDKQVTQLMNINKDVAYGGNILPPGIRSRFIQNVNGLTMHILESGFEEKSRPCILLLHGFPELAFSWRKQMLPLAKAGFHVVAPDQRGYGLTTGWDGNYDGDIASFRFINLVKDMLSLTFSLGKNNVAAVIGHDFGSPVAAYGSLIRPDVFRSVVLMSAPFAGPPQLPFSKVNTQTQPGIESFSDIHDDLAALPEPRKHYQRYYSTREANDNMLKAPQGLHNFLRAYYHFKSSDWKQNKPYPLKSWSAEELSRLPKYYIMDLNKGMAETVAREMPSPKEIEACKWLTDKELDVYAAEYSRNGFQGGLQWYRSMSDPDLELFSGLTINVPSCFIAGASDWGIYQAPGRFETMKTTACTKMSGTYLVNGAGHWVQQEQPEKTNSLLIEFLKHSQSG